MDVLFQCNAFARLKCDSRFRMFVKAQILKIFQSPRRGSKSQLQGITLKKGNLECLDIKT